ncbi:hypothetical protein H072_4256 [Dactylellina haptotyla CBS 200.50]|uniref:C3H1-type domain-containing protein n=1 Tax=Dactylellina haptotyla (strain CBS 200.50) TaxID=1284197 RepID=S8AL25_DACHA|nr:hypothetical protein H072_4256 [Dactylellina haptotyla CBS 200.50]
MSKQTTNVTQERRVKTLQPLLREDPGLCSFLGISEGHVAPPPVTPKRRVVECTHWLRGSCNYGQNCWFKHTPGLRGRDDPKRSQGRTLSKVAPKTLVSQSASPNESPSDSPGKTAATPDSSNSSAGETENKENEVPLRRAGKKPATACVELKSGGSANDADVSEARPILIQWLRKGQNAHRFSPPEMKEFLEETLNIFYDASVEVKYEAAISGLLSHPILAGLSAVIRSDWQLPNLAGTTVHQVREKVILALFPTFNILKEFTRKLLTNLHFLSDTGDHASFQTAVSLSTSVFKSVLLVLNKNAYDNCDTKEIAVRLLFLIPRLTVSDEKDREVLRRDAKELARYFQVADEIRFRYTGDLKIHLSKAFFMARCPAGKLEACSFGAQWCCFQHEDEYLATARERISNMAAAANSDREKNAMSLMLTAGSMRELRDRKVIERCINEGTDIPISFREHYMPLIEQLRDAKLQKQRSKLEITPKEEKEDVPVHDKIQDTNHELIQIDDHCVSRLSSLPSERTHAKPQHDFGGMEDLKFPIANAPLAQSSNEENILGGLLYSVASSSDILDVEEPEVRLISLTPHATGTSTTYQTDELGLAEEFEGSDTNESLFDLDGLIIPIATSTPEEDPSAFLIDLAFEDLPGHPTLQLPEASLTTIVGPARRESESDYEPSVLDELDDMPDLGPALEPQPPNPTHRRIIPIMGLDCGHFVRNIAVDEEGGMGYHKCAAKVVKQHPVCAHAVEVKCHFDIYRAGFACEICGARV